jgi:hypothetical protein
MKAVACLQPVLTMQAGITAEAMRITALAARMMIMDMVVTGTTTMVMAAGMTTMDTVAGMTTTGTVVTGTTDIP